MIQVGKRRTPKGVDSKKQIALRLKPTERKSIEYLSEKCNQSMSSIAREALLAGLPLITKNLQPASTGTITGWVPPTIKANHSHD